MTGPILVVDDEPLVCDFLRHCLVHHGYEVTSSLSAHDALDQIAAGLSPSLVLIDLCMSVMDGNELLDKLQEGPAASTPKILLTAYMDRLRADLQGRLKATLEKPISCKELVQQIQKVVGTA